MAKIKDLIPIDIRISMLQTCFNVAGSNYTGRKVDAIKVTKYAYQLYVGMMKQIKATEKDRILAVIHKPEYPTKQVSRRSTQRLLKKVVAKTK